MGLSMAVEKMITRLKTPKGLFTILIFIVTVLAAILSGTMGTAGPGSKILFVAWLFVPAPIIFVLLFWQKLSGLAAIVGKTYISLSIVLTILLLLAVAWSGSETALHPGPASEDETLSMYPQLEENIEPVSFLAADGVKLSGWIAIGDSENAVVLLHGYTGDRTAMLPQASMLFEEGFTVLLFDFRHRGESEGDFVSFGYYEKQDVLAAVDLIEDVGETMRESGRTGIESIGLIGLSNGGATAILFAAENPGRIKAIVIDSAFKSLDSAVSQSFTHFVGLPAFPFAPITVWFSELRTGLNRKDVIPEDAIANITNTPVLIIHGLEDETISYRDSEAIYLKANQPKDLWLVPGAEHGDASEIEEQEYRNRIVAFFTEHLK